nr:ethylene-responsive transcription factor ERF105 [Ipomoea trifida]
MGSVEREKESASSSDAILENVWANFIAKNESKESREDYENWDEILHRLPSLEEELQASINGGPKSSSERKIKMQSQTCLEEPLETSFSDIVEFQDLGSDYLEYLLLTS